uniref:Cytochrome c oxidase assembly protein COX20, mitochondrial n=1 Tax=Spermophilus dauricus TaxID=99837 RepID=A0A8C9P1W3_SPEDA
WWSPFKLLEILDIENTPCVQNLISCGSLGSLGAGLGHFLLTSGIGRSGNVAGCGGQFSEALSNLAHCQYNYAKTRIQERIAIEGTKNRILYENTHLYPERKQIDSSSSSN